MNKVLKKILLGVLIFVCHSALSQRTERFFNTYYIQDGLSFTIKHETLINSGPYASQDTLIIHHDTIKNKKVLYFNKKVIFLGKDNTLHFIQKHNDSIKVLNSIRFIEFKTNKRYYLGELYTKKSPKNDNILYIISTYLSDDARDYRVLIHKWEQGATIKKIFMSDNLFVYPQPNPFKKRRKVKVNQSTIKIPYCSTCLKGKETLQWKTLIYSKKEGRYMLKR